MSSRAPILRIENLRKHYGAVAALSGVSFAVEAGARLAIIGPNGAGKSTLFNLIAGEIKPSEGRICFNDADVTALPVHARANLGMGHTFQRNNLFLGLTVLENVRLAVQHRRGVASQWFKPAQQLDSLRQASESLLQQVGLHGVSEQRVSTLSYGQQRTLEVALALAAAPKLLLLDEPTAGMSPIETRELTHLIEALPRALTVIIVEHDMDVVFALSERIIVLHYGEVLADGKPDAVKHDARVIEAYLGI